MPQQLDARQFLLAAVFLLGCAGVNPYPSSRDSGVARDSTALSFADQGERVDGMPGADAKGKEGCVSGTPCDTGNPCARGALDCSTGACVPTGPAPTGTSCRPAQGPCDAPEVCGGVSTTCPADGFAPDGTACGAGTCSLGTCKSTTTSGCGPLQQSQWSHEQSPPQSRQSKQPSPAACQAFCNSFGDTRCCVWTDYDQSCMAWSGTACASKWNNDPIGSFHWGTLCAN